MNKLGHSSPARFFVTVKEHQEWYNILIFLRVIFDNDKNVEKLAEVGQKLFIFQIGYCRFL
jgi:hypothetical protein